ncbi:phosphoglycerate dehydrogenase [Flavobacterium sp.]|uniref:phosphoglycerate dehydrogenase n=1 Tax=Flavobacterium sp. TaxID=239 RepID=UPI00286DF2D5|nr:phosphoglycerate dehydrogenase [Flavobacterium sp.]
MKILLTSTSFQDTPGAHHDLLNDQGYHVDILRGPVTESVLLPIIQEYDAVLCGDDEYTEKVLIKGKEGKLKYISKYGVGLDRIDLEAAKKLGIPVKNCPGVNQISVSEHVLALLFTFEKNIHLQNETTKQGGWARITGNEIQGKTIGIIGLGAVGKELVKKALALGMKVIGFDLFRNEAFIKDFPEMIFTENIEDIYANADVISLHIPHTPQSEKLINEDVIFNKLKNNPIIINTSRGMLIDTDAIIKGLSEGKIRGYLTDVLAIEPIDENEKLKGVENVIITPHVGSRTYQSVVRQGTMAVENLMELVNTH